MQGEENSLLGVDLSNRYAQVDPSSLRIDDRTMPLYHPPLVIVEAGQNPPLNAPVPHVLLRKTGAPSLIPLLMSEGSAQATGSLPLNSGAGFAVGEDIGLAIAASGEVIVPATWTITYATGAGPLAQQVVGLTAGTSQANLYQGKCTVAIPPNVNITLTSRATDGTLQNRVHQMAALYKMPNLAATPFDQSVAGGGGATATLTKTLTTAGATSQSNELAILAFSNNSGTGTLTRTPEPLAPFTLLTYLESESTGSARSLMVAYRVLNTAGPVSGSVQITSSDGSSGGWAAAMATYKAA